MAGDEDFSCAGTLRTTANRNRNVAKAWYSIIRRKWRRQCVDGVGVSVVAGPGASAAFAREAPDRELTTPHNITIPVLHFWLICKPFLKTFATEESSGLAHRLIYSRCFGAFLECVKVMVVSDNQGCSVLSMINTRGRSSIS